MARNSGVTSLGAIWAEVLAGLGGKVHESALDSRFCLAAEDSVQDRIFHLHSGKVKLTRATSMGRDHLLEVLGPTDTIGLNALTDSPAKDGSGGDNFLQHSPVVPEQSGKPETEDSYGTSGAASRNAARTWFATATTVEPVQLDWVLVTDAGEYLANHQALYLELLRALNRQTELLYQRTMALRDVDVPGRIAAALLELMEKFGQPLESDTDEQLSGQMPGGATDTVCETLRGTDFPATGVRLPHGLSQLELGQMAGASRETANKVLADFISRGWIIQKRRSIIIMNEERLRYRAS